MFSHIMIGTNDIEESRVFYDKLFEVLGAKPGKMIPSRTGLKRYFYNFNNTSFAISEPLDGKEASVANGATIGFNLESVEQGGLWHMAGVQNGGTSIEEPPGIREYDGYSFYLAYLRDPTGHKLCGLMRVR